jgi:hypothetical protein
MGKSQVKFLISLVLVSSMTLCSVTSFAATSSDSGEVTTQAGPKKYLSNIIFAGLAGAVLGLSTLSFYGKPQQRLSNIAVGFAIGVILGTGYSTYKAAAEPHEFYGLAKGLEPEILAQEESDRFSPDEKPVMFPGLVFKF